MARNLADPRIAGVFESHDHVRTRRLLKEQFGYILGAPIDYTGRDMASSHADLGIQAATQGRVDAHVIRAAAGTAFSSQPHRPLTDFQLVYILKGWIEFEYEGQGVVRLEAGSCVHQPPGIRHRELGHSDDIEMLEVVLPAGFATEEVASVNG